MDTLKKEDGFTIIESLVGIILLSLFVGLSAMVINGIYSRPQILMKGEASTLASQEIDYSLKMKPAGDTVYENGSGNMVVRREITQADSLAHIVVTVSAKGSGRMIARLSVYDYR